MDFPEELKYSKTHEWVKLEADNQAVIGITDFAQHELGDIVYLELPEADDTIEKDSALGVIESTKATEDIYSPLSGAVIEVNAPLIDSPELMNSDPYGDAWLIRIELTNPGELADLMSAGQYKKFIESISE
jgi:glycine cleavage system H protein